MNAPVNASAESEATGGAFQGPLPGLADRFRFQVTRELARLEASVRDPLRGDYLFVIDGAPRFVVVLRKGAVHSGAFVAPREPHVPFAPLEGPEGEEAAEPARPLECLRLPDVEASARACVHTDATTLARLLAGTMKAKAAFLAGKVRIEGDLPGFLRLIGHLKARGVRAPGEGSA